ncbi:MAG: lipopolysaccharide kinase InaA family protein [Phycisphaerae bacterium]
MATEEGKTHELYLKRYELEPFHRRFWRVLSEWRLDANPASAEGYNIEIARDARIPTMEVVAWDWASRSFTAGRSYIIVTAVPGEAISRCGKDFLARHAGENAGKRLATKLGDLAARMHKAGLVHRDFYSTHIFLDDRGDDFDLYLIDLARMFRPRWRKFRWRVKDLAQLKFSMPREWVDGHWETFLGEYLAKMGIDAGLEDRYRRAIDSKAAWMLRRRQRTAARREAAR